VAFFEDSQQLYGCTRALLDRVQDQHPDAADAILASRLVIRLSTKEPDIEITINGRKRPVQITYGPGKLRPTLDIEMEADTLHRILLSEQSLKKAFVDGLVKVRGPVWKTADLAALFDYGRQIYPQVLIVQGLTSAPTGTHRR
jgi:hypothetical protein